MKSLITVMVLAALQEIVYTSLSGKEHGDAKPGDENDEFVFADESQDPSRTSRQFCEDNNERCKVRNGQITDTKTSQELKQL